MNNKLGFSRITFIMMLGVFAASTFALTQYAHAERHVHKHASKAMCKVCGMPKAQCTCPAKKAMPQKEWCDGHGARDTCHLKKKEAAPAAAEPEKQGWWSRTWCRTKALGAAAGTRVRGWFKRSPKVSHAELSDVTAAEFDKLVASGKPVVAKFHATWCPACKAMQPIDDQVSKKHPDVTFVQVDTDKFGDLAAKLGVKGIPTYVFYNNKEKQFVESSMSAEKFSKKVADLAK